VTAPDANVDAARFQAWQRDALKVWPPGTRVVRAGPFHAVVPQVDDARGWVTLVDAGATPDGTECAVAELREVFARRAITLEVEFNETAFPGVGSWLEHAGLTLVERNPLMACRPDRFRPFAAPEVVLRQLTARSESDELQAFQTIRWTNGGDHAGAPPPVSQLRKDLAAPGSVYLLAWAGGEPAGTGVSHLLSGAVEIVGVVTRIENRRRGIAAAVTSELVRRRFASDADFAFLDAANEGAARVYERLGFTRFGSNLVYRDPAP
jgi:RimJ/RimL family protein N-acetyltransferase